MEARARFGFGGLRSEVTFAGTWYGSPHGLEQAFVVEMRLSAVGFPTDGLSVLVHGGSCSGLR